MRSGFEDFGIVMGLMSPLMLPLNLAALQLMPWAYDFTGDYGLGLRVFLAAIGLASLALLWLRLPRKRQV